MPIILPGKQHLKQSMNVTTLHGQVVIQLSVPANEIVLDPQSAAELASALAHIVQDLIKSTKPPRILT